MTFLRWGAMPVAWLMDPIPSESSSAPVTRDDAQELASFATPSSYGGHKQFFQLYVAFSPISVITGSPPILVMGFNWWVVGIVFLVDRIVWADPLALLLAELSNRMPLSGYGYQWTSRLMNPHGFFVGWLLMLQFTRFSWRVCHINWPVSGWGAIGWIPEVLWFSLCVITLTTLIHLFGIRQRLW